MLDANQRFYDAFQSCSPQVTPAAGCRRAAIVSQIVALLEVHVECLASWE